MSQSEILLPKMGESVAEATIIKWLKNEGDFVKADEAIVEIATDKVDSEVPSTAEGVLLKRLCNEGDVVQVGKAIALIGAEGAKPAVSTTPAKETVSSNEKPAVSAPLKISSSNGKSENGSSKFYSPLVKNIAKTEGLSVMELEAIAGTGLQGRVTKKDILNYLPNRKQGGTSVVEQPVQEKQPVTQVSVKASEPVGPVVTAGAGDEIIEMDRMRKLIADHMVMSKRVSPHVTSFVEADVTNIVLWREKIKKEFEKKEGEKLTFTPLFIEAIVKAIKDFPMINISLTQDNKIVVRKDINVGMAAALPTGNLIVPVIKNADRYNLVGLTKAVNDLANRARLNQLKPDEIQGGTYTISNVGTFGNVMGTPIINQPQVAIMALGAIRKKPAVIETPFGDTIGIRHMMFLSHSYDHRVVDGALGGSFVKRVADYLENFNLNREI
ncbi:MAG TPA: dihydrolipoamide acetyltransferase family protein [Flavobacteriales bacterium]|nr:dihydrolipoamide acetyltransferase family protein [Flavobacteriales bacterium]